MGDRPESSSEEHSPDVNRTASMSALQRYKKQKDVVKRTREQGGSLDRSFARSTTELSGIGHRRGSSLQHPDSAKKQGIRYHDWEDGQALLDESVRSALFTEKNEVDLSVGILEHVLEQCRSLTTALNDEAQRKELGRVADQISNAALLLHKFKADTAATAAAQENRLKNVLEQKLSVPLQLANASNADGKGDQDDQDVVQFISETVFNPVELTAIRDTNAKRQRGSMRASLEIPSAQEYFSSPRANPSEYVELSRVGVVDTSEQKQKGAGERRTSLSDYMENVSQSLEEEDSKADPAVGEARSAAVEAVIKNDVALRGCLSSASDWNTFDVFALDARSNSRLLVLMTFLFDRVGLFTEFNIPHAEFTNFFMAIEAKYQPMPYHDAVHAADVVQNMYVFLRTESLSKRITSLDVFAGLVAAAVHDVGHPGTNNAFQVATSSPLALRYNDRSVLENMHVAETFKLLARPGCDILKGLSADKRKELRESIIVMVLATDMAQHLHVLSELQTSLASHKEKQTHFSRSSRADRLLLLKTALHCADVANPCKPLPLYQKWVDKIVAEWFQQGDMEREAGLPVSALMDRNAPNVPGSQVGFIDFFIKPLYELWHVLLPEIDYCMVNLDTNRAHYHGLVPRKDTEEKV